MAASVTISPLLRRSAIYGVVLALLALCLFLDTTPVRMSRWLGLIAAEVLATFRDPGTQWMVYACCAVYFLTFTILSKRGSVFASHRPDRARSTERGMGTNVLPRPDVSGADQTSNASAQGQPSEFERRGNQPSQSPLNPQQSTPWWGEAPARSPLNLFLSPDTWLCALAVWVTVRYVFDYDTASRNTHALALMAGMAIGQGVRTWAGWKNQRNRHLTPTLSPVEAEREQVKS